LDVPQRGRFGLSALISKPADRRSDAEVGDEAQLLLSLKNYVLGLPALAGLSGKPLTDRLLLRRTLRLRRLGSRRLLRCRLCRSLSLRLGSLRLADLGKQSLEDSRLLRSQTLHNLRLLSSLHFFEVGFTSSNVVAEPSSYSLTGCKVRLLTGGQEVGGDGGLNGVENGLGDFITNLDRTSHEMGLCGSIATGVSAD
jgi:hypothetical protein